MIAETNNVMEYRLHFVFNNWVAGLISWLIRPVTRGGFGGFVRTPLFANPPFKNTKPPPQTYQLHIWHRILSISISAVSIPTQHTWPTSWSPLPTSLRTPFNTPSEPPTRSNRLNNPKVPKLIATGESSGTLVQFCCANSVQLTRRRQVAAYKPVLDYPVDTIHAACTYATRRRERRYL